MGERNLGAPRFILPQAPAALGSKGRLILLSQNVAGNRDQNQLLGEIHVSAHRGLTWIAKLRRTVNRGLPGMSRG